VAIVDHGQVKALDTPRRLIASLGGEHVIEFSCDGDGDAAAWHDPDRFADLPAVSAARREAGGVALSVKEPHVALPALLERLQTLNGRLTNLTTRHASLEDVFVKFAGRHLEEADNEITANSK
jgi:ABC-2 type transport system ATP-binding protein